MSTVKKEFKTEVRQLLDLVIHSLYSNKEIFLRELISNASDAIDKARYEALTNKAIDSNDLKITLKADKEAKTLTITDNGIGMTLEEVEENIGTIARSGTKAFMQNLKDQADSPELIGQFGVGFYSAFMVAENVTLTTKKAGSDVSAVKWFSEGTGEYEVADAEKTTQGTEIVVKLKDEFEEFLDEWKVRKIVTKFSDYIEYPVSMTVTRMEGEDDDKKEVEKEEVLNTRKAIWARPKNEITDEEYSEFYKHISHDYGEPLETIHWNVEGTSEFRGLVYIPESVPMDFMMPDRKKGLHLYVRRVFITDKCEELLPEYLRFAKGVIDSSDLPLNVSREILQEDRQIRIIQKNVVKKILDTLKNLKEKDYDKYLKFWKAFGKVLKEGMHFDFANKEKIQDLLLFKSSESEADKYTTLAAYVDAMPEGQESIYYITGDSLDQVKNSPHLEAFRKKGYEVLFLTDPIDEWVVQSLTEYNEKKLQSITKGDIDLASSEEEKEEQRKEQEEADKKYKTLLENVQKHLDEDIKEVRLSHRLTDSACCLVADEFGIDVNMQRIMEAMGQEVPKTKRILELNPTHPVLEVMSGLDGENLNNYIDLMYDQALLMEGSPVRNSLNFAKMISELMVKSK